MINKQFGVIAVLDALGASNYTDKDIQRFLKSREIVISLLNEKSDKMSKKLSVNRLSTFIFQDTVLIVLESDAPQPSPEEIEAFLITLRKFLVDSLVNGILFRGAFAVGAFYRDDDTNTILGEALADAASWYEKADWIGVISTPRTSLYLRYLIEKNQKSFKHLMLDYDVPLTTGGTRSLKTVNWPKVFWVDGITPCRQGESKRETLLRLLSNYAMLGGTEKKYYASLEYFEYAMKTQKLQNRP
jgi:hypothetical protein